MSRIIIMGSPDEQTTAPASTASDAALARQLNARAAAATHHSSTLRDAATALAAMPTCRCWDPDQEPDDDEEDDED